MDGRPIGLDNDKGAGSRARPFHCAAAGAAAPSDDLGYQVLLLQPPLSEPLAGTEQLRT